MVVFRGDFVPLECCVLVVKFRFFLERVLDTQLITHGDILIVKWSRRFDWQLKYLPGGGEGKMNNE